MKLPIDGHLRPLIAFGPLMALVTPIVYFREQMPPWLVACLLSTALVWGFKWHTLVRLQARGMALTWSGIIRYYVQWPGMDAEPFFQPKSFIHKPTRGEFAFAISKMIGGAAIVWGAVRMIPSDDVQLRGWTATVGVVMLIHFGLFELAMLQLHRDGTPVIPFMRQPFSSVTLGELWGKRWSTGFHYLSYPLVFKPVERVLGVLAGLISTYIFSGLVHEILMCYPASGGYGIPTAYFVTEAMLMLLQRSRTGRRWGIQKGLAGRIYTMVGFFVPMMIGFSLMPFFRDVLLPLLHAVGAL